MSTFLYCPSVCNDGFQMNGNIAVKARLPPVHAADSTSLFHASDSRESGTHSK